MKKFLLLISMMTLLVGCLQVPDAPADRGISVSWNYEGFRCDFAGYSLNSDCYTLNHSYVSFITQTQEQTASDLDSLVGQESQGLGKRVRYTIEGGDDSTTAVSTEGLLLRDPSGEIILETFQEEWPSTDRKLKWTLSCLDTVERATVSVMGQQVLDLNEKEWCNSYNDYEEYTYKGEPIVSINEAQNLWGSEDGSDFSRLATLYTFGNGTNIEVSKIPAKRPTQYIQHTRAYQTNRNVYSTYQESFEPTTTGDYLYDVEFYWLVGEGERGYTITDSLGKTLGKLSWETQGNYSYSYIFNIKGQRYVTEMHYVHRCTDHWDDTCIAWQVTSKWSAESNVDLQAIQHFLTLMPNVVNLVDPVHLIEQNVDFALAAQQHSEFGTIDSSLGFSVIMEEDGENFLDALDYFGVKLND